MNIFQTKYLPRFIPGVGVVKIMFFCFKIVAEVLNLAAELKRKKVTEAFLRLALPPLKVDAAATDDDDDDGRVGI